jgi:hypothetical protein
MESNFVTYLEELLEVVQYGLGFCYFIMIHAVFMEFFPYKTCM